MQFLTISSIIAITLKIPSTLFKIIMFVLTVWNWHDNTNQYLTDKMHITTFMVIMI